jgi:GntR family transcriptional regulator / MocR family aminotransferase
MNRTTFARELLLRVTRGSGVPLRLQLERELRQAIRTGRVTSGTLPSTRALAADLAVSRGVVVEAYEQLLAEGYLVAAPGSSTRVAKRSRPNESNELQAPTAPLPEFDFRPGLPDLSLFPRRAWLASTRRVLATAANEALDYPDPRGPHDARAAIAAYLNRARATMIRAERLVLSSGSAQGIGVLCRALYDRGVRRIAVEDPGHADQCTDIQAVGLETPRIPVDRHGICIDRVARSGAGAVLVTPAHQYPTGVVLSPARRAELLEWARRRGTFIIEDDYDAEYRYDREPVGALQGLAPDRVVYVGSASKVLSPALRIGWVGVPEDLMSDVTRHKLLADRGSSALDQLSFADFVTRGELDRHLRRTRHIYRRRRDILVDALQQRCPGVRINGVAAGLHLLMELAPGAPEDAVVLAAQQQSIRVYGARPYWAGRNGPAALLIGYGSLHESRIPEGVERLARVLRGCRRGAARSAAPR